MPVRVRLRFQFDSELDQPRAWLSGERLNEFQVQVNGQAIIIAKEPGSEWARDFALAEIGSQGVDLHILALPVAAVLASLFAAGVVDQDAPHGLGGCGKEMAAIVPVLLSRR